MAKCDNCRNKDNYMACDECLHDATRKDWYEPMTNADHIRSMSDEELGKLLYGLGYEAYQYALIPDLKPIADTESGWIEWLKQPYKENA